VYWVGRIGTDGNRLSGDSTLCMAERRARLVAGPPAARARGVARVDSRARTYFCGVFFSFSLHDRDAGTPSLSSRDSIGVRRLAPAGYRRRGDARCKLRPRWRGPLWKLVCAPLAGADQAAAKIKATERPARPSSAELLRMTYAEGKIAAYLLVGGQQHPGCGRRRCPEQGKTSEYHLSSLREARHPTQSRGARDSCKPWTT